MLLDHTPQGVDVVIHRSPFPDVVVPEISVTEYVLALVDQRADKTALVEGPTGRSLTYGELRDQIQRLAGGLRARGLGPGDVIAIMALNCPEYAIAFHGAAFAGITVTTINPTYTPGEVHHQLVDSGASMVLTSSMFLDTARAGAEGTKVDTFVLLDGEGDGDTLGFASLFGDPLTEQVPVDPDDVVVLPYSSGTTGLSKGVMLTHRNLVANIEQVISPADMTDQDSFVVVLPMFHIYGMQVLMNSGLRAGATLVTMPRFDLEGFLRLNQEHRATRAFVAPPMIVALAKHPMVDDFDLSTLNQVFSGAAPLSAELALEAGGRLGCEVVQGYGMTELSPVTHLTPTGQFKPGSVGLTAPSTELMIVDPTTGSPLDIDQDGELWVRGPQVMKGYLNNPTATAGTIDDDGWLHTGDIGHIDADGHVFIVDRLKELIKFKGFQVAPAELEALLLTHPAVADAAVIGVPDDEAGEVPVGYVVLKPGQELSEADILDFVAGQVATYKRLRTVHFVDQIPKSPSGKILRRVLRDEAASA